jgi:hypothetical protein
VAITEKQRHDLFTKFEETLGPEHTATMMELLPPVGWADVATKHDLTRELAVLRAEVRADTYRVVLTAMSVQTAVIGVLLAAFG